MAEQPIEKRCTETCKAYDISKRCMIKPEYPVGVRYRDLCYLTVSAEEIRKDRILRAQTQAKCTELQEAEKERAHVAVSHLADHLGYSRIDNTL